MNAPRTPASPPANADSTEPAADRDGSTDGASSASNAPASSTFDLAETLESHSAIDLGVSEGAPASSGFDLTIDSHPSMSLVDGDTVREASDAEIDLDGDRPRRRGIPGFELLRLIGRGGMGVVYEARQLGVNRAVAIKMLHLGDAATPEQAIRFRLEGEIAARVDHPNVVRVFETGVLGSQSYLVLEWVEGGTLAHLLKKSKLPARDAAAVTLALAHGAFACHVNGIVHRDIKPANVLLAKTPAGSTTLSGATTLQFVPKLTDFGIAKSLGVGAGMTETGMVMGTAEYMAPEQAAGKGHSVGPAADVYALGVVLYQMLVGRTPFRGDSVVSTLKAVMEQPPEAPTKVAGSIPKDLETVCLKCLEKQPSKRYATAGELAEDLRRFLAGEVIAARRASRLEIAQRWVRRHPAEASLWTALAASVTIGAALATWQWRVAVGERDHAVVAERQAVAAADEARAVVRYLVDDVLNAAAPTRLKGRTLAVADVLEEGAARLDFAQFPNAGAEAGVSTALGGALFELGKWPLAEKRFRRAAELRRATEGPDGAGVVEAELMAAACVAEQKQGAESAPTIRAAADRARKVLGATHPTTVLGDVLTASMLRTAEERAAARKLLEDVVAELRAKPNDAPRERRRALNQLGRVAYDAGDFAAAEAAFDEYLQTAEAAGGALHPDAVEALTNRGAARERIGKPREAKADAAEALARCQKVYGPANDKTCSAMNNLGRLLLAEGDLDAAERSIGDAHRGFKVLYANLPDHEDLLAAESNLLQIHLKRKRYTDALSLADRQLVAARKSRPAGSPEIATAAYYKALALLLAYKLKDDPARFRTATDEAISLLEEARAIHARQSKPTAELKAVEQTLAAAKRRRPPSTSQSDDRNRPSSAAR